MHWSTGISTEMGNVAVERWQRRVGKSLCDYLAAATTEDRQIAAAAETDSGREKVSVCVCVWGGGQQSGHAHGSNSSTQYKEQHARAEATASLREMNSNP